MRATALLCIVFAIGGFFYSRQQQLLPGHCAAAIALPVAIAGMVAAIWMRYRSTAALLIAGAAVVAIVALLNCGIETVAQRESVAQLIQAADAQGYGTLRVAMLNTTEQTAQFYASGRLLYGADGVPERFEGTNEVLEALPQNGGSLLILTPVDQLSRLRELKRATTDVIGSNGRIAIAAITIKSSGER